MKHKILIVEDDHTIIELFREFFTRAGFDIEILDLGKKALEKLEKVRSGKDSKPELVLLDLILPDMNGIEVLKEIRKYPETKDLKVFALTNYNSPESNNALKKEGIDKILIKSQYGLDELVKIIREAIK